MQPHNEHSGPQVNDALGWEISRQQAQAYLECGEKEVARALGRPVDVRLEQGRPAERIVALASELGAEVTVLGNHGERSGPACDLGSTVQQVLAVARSSVLIARASPVAPATVHPKRLLVPLDGSLRSESVLPAAVRIANGHGAEILLVHVVQEPLPTGLLRAAEDMDLARELAVRLECGARTYLERLRQQLAHEVTAAHALVMRRANERQCLLEISQTEGCDLIVLSAHGAACDSARSFGSVTSYLLANATVPLLVLQDVPEDGLRRTTTPLPPPLRARYAPESV
jgi:nucleotide-binding universal stress UspA family protein